MSVSIQPGAIAFTCMLCGASSMAIDLVNWTIAPRRDHPSASNRTCRHQCPPQCRHTISSDPIPAANRPSSYHESFDFRPVQVCPHYPHALPVGPVKLAAPLLQLELLRRERAARRNDGDHVLAIEIRPHDRAIIPGGITHIRPVDVPSGDIEHQAIGQPPAFVDDGLQIGAIRVCGQYAAPAEVQEEEPVGRWCVSRTTLVSKPQRRRQTENLVPFIRKTPPGVSGAESAPFPTDSPTTSLGHVQHIASCAYLH